MPTPTTNFAFNLPTVGGDADNWGGFLNGNWTSLDALLTSLFANNRAATRPAAVRNGGLWTDSDDNTIKFYNGTIDVPLVRVTADGQEVLLAPDGTDYIGRSAGVLALFMNSTAVVRFIDTAVTFADEYLLRFGTDGDTTIKHDAVDGFEITSTVDVKVTSSTEVRVSAPDTVVEGNLEVTGDLVIGGAGGVPSGAVMAFAMSTAPAGWLKANGAAVSRATYAALFAAIGTTYGVGDGATTFNLPDMRGEFARGWVDDRTLDPQTGRLIGSSELDAFQDHIHPQSTGGNAHDNNREYVAGEGPTTLARDTGTAGDNTRSRRFATHEASVLTAQRTTTETRPRNVALLYCVKT